MNEYTEDTLFDGDLLVRQWKRGYRFSVDPVLLSHYARPGRYDSVLDLGTGCGIIPLILTYRHLDIKVTGVELQSRLASLAGFNVERNNREDRVKIIRGDIKKTGDFLPSEKFDLIITNPPYIEKKAGRINPQSQKAVARHEIEITLERLVEKSAGLLKPGARFVVVYPSFRLADLMMAMRKGAIEPKRLRMVHPLKGGGAKLLLMEGVKKGQPGMEIEPPLFIYEEGGGYSREVQKMFEKM